MTFHGTVFNVCGFGFADERSTLKRSNLMCRILYSGEVTLDLYRGIVKRCEFWVHASLAWDLGFRFSALSFRVYAV